MQLSAKLDSMQNILQPFDVSYGEILIYDDRDLPLPAKDITFMHYHNCCELGLVFRGNGLFTVENKVYSVGVGDIIFIPKDVKHYSKSLDSKDKSRCRFIYFDAEQLLRKIGLSDGKVSELLRRISGTQPILTANDKQYGALRRFTDEVFNNGGDISLCGVYFYEYLLKLDSVETVIEANTHDGAMDTVLRYMTLHFNSDISLSELAKLCFLSKSQLNRRFQAAYGVSPIQWLNRFRLYSARELLKNTDYSIIEISEKSGFKNTSDLYRHFKAKFGVSPKQYQNNNKAK